ncbi:MAG: hypothetical protein BIFFINMI_01874 [Phycisphaerae bacterium]|nr:hypothetical protein [Phycisphaerae bacterium]
MRTTLTLTLATLAGLAASVTRADGPPTLGCNADCTRITGQLEWSRREGAWVLRYATAAAARSDPHGGRFILGRPALLRRMKVGQIVRVTGHPLPATTTAPASQADYELATAEALTAPPQGPALSDVQRKLVESAEAMDRAGRQYPADFGPAVDLAVSSDSHVRQRLFILERQTPDGMATELIDDPIDARGAVERHIAGAGGSYAAALKARNRLAQDEKVDAVSSTPLYHRVETAFKTTDGRSYRMVYLVLRPGFLASAPTNYAAWLTAGGRGLRLGEAARGEATAFASAADLLACLVIGNTGDPLLLDRSLRDEGASRRWTGQLAWYVGGPMTKVDWKFGELTIAADAAGALAISRRSADDEPAAQVAEKLDWRCVRGDQTRYRQYVGPEAVVRGLLTVEKDPTLPPSQAVKQYFLATEDGPVRLLTERQDVEAFNRHTVAVKGKWLSGPDEQPRRIWVGWIADVPDAPSAP